MNRATAEQANAAAKRVLISNEEEIRNKNVTPDDVLNADEDRWLNR
jgi:hypothetical protein